MSYRKYLQDYRIEEYIDNKGRVKSTAVYAGGYFEVSPALPKSDKRLMLAISSLSWVFLIGALSFDTGAGRLWYVIMPFVVAVFPMYFTTLASVSLLFGNEKLTRERAGLMSRRLPASPLSVAILSGAAFIGLVSTAVFYWKAMPVNDILFAASSLIISCAASLVFVKCRRLKTKPINDGQLTVDDGADCT